MFVSVSRTYSNPATVANLIRVNGLDAVRRTGLVRPEVLLAVRRSVMRGEFCEYRKMLCDRRITPRFMAMMKCARQHGPDCLRSAELRPYSARLVSALSDAWNERLDEATISARHGWDVALLLRGMARSAIYAKALRMGLDLEAVPLPLDPDFSYSEGSPVVTRYRAGQRVMRRTCRLFGVTPDDLRGAGRNRDVSIPRHFYSYWAKRLAKFSYPEIGRRMGGRDHTTALNSVNKWPASRDKARQIIEARKLAGKSGGRKQR